MASGIAVGTAVAWAGAATVASGIAVGAVVRRRGDGGFVFGVAAAGHDGNQRRHDYDKQQDPGRIRENNGRQNGSFSRSYYGNRGVYRAVYSSDPLSRLSSGQSGRTEGPSFFNGFVNRVNFQAEGLKGTDSQEGCGNVH